MKGKKKRKEKNWKVDEGNGGYLLVLGFSSSSLIMLVLNKDHTHNRMHKDSI